MIDIVNLWHHYGARPTLSDVSLRVNPGEVVAVMGPNGMGKSTLLAVVAGILPAWKGHVEIDGLKRRSSIDAEKQIRRKVAYLPDTPWLPEHSTPHEFALAVGRLYGVAEDRLFARTDELLESFDLAPSADAPIRNLSTGQRKKVALVATLATEAPVLVLDEPFSGGLDSSALLALQRIIKDLTHRRAATVLMAVPVPELVDVVAQRVAIIKQGRLLACDTPAGLRGSTQTQTLGEALEKLINPERFARMMAGAGERGTT